MKTRISYVDFLKFIGLTCIIIAHVGSPNSIMMIRNFDVQLMVIISSILASYSVNKFSNDKEGIIKYFISRIKRLVIPTWIFLTIYFVLNIIVTKKIMNPKYYISTYLLTRYGFGYVWVILIYLYSALLIPIYRKIEFNKRNNILILLIYILYEIMYILKIGINIKVIETTIYYIIPYGLLTYIGYNYSKISSKGKKVMCGSALIIFLGIFIYLYFKTGSIQNVQIAKYPPRIYYLSYGLLISITLIELCKMIKLKIYSNNMIQYISKHSLWIYLWHVMYLSLYKYTCLPNKWYIKLVVIYLLSLITVYIVNKILDIIEKKHNIFFIKYLRG